MLIIWQGVEFLGIVRLNPSTENPPPISSHKALHIYVQFEQIFRGNQINNVPYN